MKHAVIAMLATAATAMAGEAPPVAWMGGLDGSIRLSRLTIPGTHDSAGWFFTSGYRPGLLGVPDIRAVSGVVNPRLEACFRSAPAGGYGCVIMDFASARTCDFMIRTNFPDAKDDLSQEILKVPVTERKVPGLPKGVATGPLPRAVLKLGLCERGEYPGDPMRTSYRVFDTGEPENDLRTVFTGPGQSQYIRFLTPLYGGYGLASGRLNRKKEPDHDGPLFWFNLLDGKSGPEVDLDFWIERKEGQWFIGSECVREIEDGEISRISRYDPIKGVVRTLEMDFCYLNWLESRDVLGVARMRGGWRVVRVDPDASTCQVLGLPPRDFDADRPARRDSEIHPAGVGCADGMYAVQGFSLWFHPKGGAWHPVIRDVHIVKTFGGAQPWLPVRYVGNGRFAVAKTVKDKVKVPKTWPEDESMFGAAEAVTMLVDGLTGEVLKQSKPFAYNHNPEPQIPDSWWSADMKPRPGPTEPEPIVNSLFRWNEKTRELRYAGDQVLKLAEDDEREESGDGRYSLIYQKCPSGGAGAKTKAIFRIIDGKTGRTHSAEVESDFYEIWIEPSWVVLTPL